MNRFANLLVLRKLVPALALAALSACGGGGGSSTTTTAASVPAAQPPAGFSAAGFPNTGTYQVLVTAQGASTALQSGLSLIHPNDRTTEYLVEAPGLSVSDSLVINSGVVDVAAQKVSNITANALLYITGGDVKRLPLAAIGTDPKAGIQVAGTTTICKFTGELTKASPAGTDYTAPLESSYYVTTKGADGVCATADDGLAEVTFSGFGKPLVTPTSNNGDVTGLKVFALRDPGTLKRSVSVVGGSSKAIEISGESAIVEAAGSLLINSVSKNGSLTTVKATPLDAVVTAGTGWESAGFDADSFYVFRNSASLANFATSTWKLVRISRVARVATVLASGSGNIAGASMGSNSILGTIVTASGFSLNKFSKTTPGLPVVLEQPSLSSFVIPSALTQSAFQLFRAFLVNGVASSYSVEILDEATNSRLYNRANAFLFGVIRSDTLFFNSSLNISGAAFTGDSLGAGGSLGSSLITYNAVNRTPTVVGQFPNAADFGSSRALAFTAGTDAAGFATGSLYAISGTTYLAAPRRYFSFNPSAAGSIVYTTSVK